MSSSLFKKLPTEGWSSVIPAEKNLPAEWEKSLFERGELKTYEGEALMNIGMPVGGACAGLVYLGGDGKLWYWDIFNRYLSGVHPRQIQYKERTWHGLPQGLGAWQGGNYIDPVRSQPSPFEQGFAVKVTSGGKAQVRTLDRNGWRRVSFTGTYPVGTVRYEDPDCPVRVTLEGYTPFCPLDFDNSSYPAVIMRYTVENTGSVEARVEIGGWMENPVLLDSVGSSPGVKIRNQVRKGPGLVMVGCSAALPDGSQPVRPDIVFEDFEKETYEGWVVEGTAFGSGPLSKDQVPAYMGDLGMIGNRAANSHASAPVPSGLSEADEVEHRDQATGRLISREFVIERNLITFLVGGGNYPGRCCINLLVDGEVVRSATGHNGHQMRAELFDVAEFTGKTAHIEIVDDMTAIAGTIGVDHIVFSDSRSPERNPDWGTMAIAVLGDGVSHANASLSEASASGLFTSEAVAETAVPIGEKPVAGVVRSLVLPPGGRETVEFVISWHFTNLPNMARGSETGLYYGKRFRDAAEVAGHIATYAKALANKTFQWRDTWYDSTLPYWFLDRAFIPVDSLASTTCFRFADGRFYTFEGVRSCLGHPNHVWHYAQAHARVFPELSNDVLDRVWYGFAFHEDGSVAFRGEHSRESAIDGHCGGILAVLRAHQTRTDSEWLRRMWPKVKKSIEYANTRDRDGDGLLDTPMLTTLDEPWHGQIPWISSMYIAALLAGEQMALEVGDAEFAGDCRRRADMGRAAMDERLFNGEWFIQLPDPENPAKLGAYETCHIDQVLGQAWAWQVGLGRAVNPETTRSALQALWKYNFSLNLDAYDEQADPKGRPYFAEGEGGLVMTANALGRDLPFGIYSPFACYLSEAMNGFEYQAAAHMIAEGLVKEGMAVIRTLDDRYDGHKRNPYNEIECGDHYARSMASYGALITISGFEYHGPRKHIGFAPKWKPEHFKAPFIAAEGWGTYEQKWENGGLKAEITIAHGQLVVKTLSLEAVGGQIPSSARVLLEGEPIACEISVNASRVLVTLSREVCAGEGEGVAILLI